MGWTEVLTPKQMRALESAAIDSGAVTGLALMERAGAAVAGHIRLRWPKAGGAMVLCGPGSNGGDGYVIARHLAEAGWQVRVLGAAPRSRSDAAVMRDRWGGPVQPLTEDALRAGPASDVYVDAICGTGLTRAPQGEVAAILACLGGSGGDWAFFRERLVAVDCPSGLCLDSGAFAGGARGPGEFDLRARLTVAFDSPKPGHLLERGPDCCGELVIADLGLRPWREQAGRGLRSAETVAIWPRFAVEDARAGLFHVPALAKAGGHKFTHGHALIVAGGFGRGGAARLAARAALRVGAGLVTLAPPKSALIEHAGPPDALMRRGVDGPDDLIALLADRRITAVALGPGCGADRAAGLLGALLAARCACVLDAGALTALAAKGFAGLHRACVLTPHVGEFTRLFPDLAEKLLGPNLPPPLRYADAGPPIRIADVTARWAASEADRDRLAHESAPLYSKLDAAREAAARCGAVVLLKGPDTVIATPDGQARIHSAFDIPWLATAGAGDVLAGIITGLLARGLSPLDAAGTGTFLHAAAARRFGPGLIADDLPDLIPAVLTTV